MLLGLPQVDQHIETLREINHIDISCITEDFDDRTLVLL
jgi:hypothetical protein